LHILRFSTPNANRRDDAHLGDLPRRLIDPVLTPAPASIARKEIPHTDHLTISRGGPVPKLVYEDPPGLRYA
jgi:hypothetical protein